MMLKLVLHTYIFILFFSNETRNPIGCSLVNEWWLQSVNITLHFTSKISHDISLVKYHLIMANIKQKK